MKDIKHDTEIKAFLLWMSRKKIRSVIPYGKVPHWTDGNKLYDVSELVELYKNENTKISKV